MRIGNTNPIKNIVTRVMVDTASALPQTFLYRCAFFCNCCNENNIWLTSTQVQIQAANNLKQKSNLS